MKKLAISPDLQLPAAETTTQTIVVYGGKGMGKTNLGAVVCEELAEASQRFCYIDPVGVAWGLRHSANGKGKGLDILILGGRHGDVPIEPTGGVVVADFIADSTESVLIDISSRTDGRRWSTPEKIRFVADYITRLLERQGEHRRPIMQIIDEAARFAPQMVMKGSDEAIRCLNAIEVLVEEGRNAGVGLMMLTQRSARMAKSVSELAEAMISFRIIGPNSVDAVLDWFGEHVHKSKWNELVEQLRKLPKGQALVVSPGWLNFEGIAAIRLRKTFDSSKTPTGTEKRLAGQVRPADLDRLRTRMAETVEKAEATDPSKLKVKFVSAERAVAQAKVDLEKTRAQVDALTEKLRLRPAATGTSEKTSEVRAELAKYRAALRDVMKLLVKVKAVNFGPQSSEALEQAVTTAVRQIIGKVTADVARTVTSLDAMKAQIAEAEDRMEKILAGDLAVQVEVTRVPPKPAIPATPVSMRVKTTPLPPMDAPDGDLNVPEQRIVNALAWWKAAGISKPTRHQAAFVARYTLNGHTANTIGALKTKGLLDYPANGCLRLTPAGEAIAAVPSEPTRAEFIERVMSVLREEPQRRILQSLLDAGAPMSREALATASKYTVNGHFNNTVGSLKTLGLATYPSSGLVELSALFASFD